MSRGKTQVFPLVFPFPKAPHALFRFASQSETWGGAVSLGETIGFPPTRPLPPEEARRVHRGGVWGSAVAQGPGSGRPALGRCARCGSSHAGHPQAGALVCVA